MTVFDVSEPQFTQVLPSNAVQLAPMSAHSLSKTPHNPNRNAKYLRITGGNRYAPLHLEINAMSHELSQHGYDSYLRHMKARTSLKTDDIVRMMVKAAGLTAIQVRKWKKDGIANKACAKAQCKLAERQCVCFGVHMLLPTKAVCQQ
ncbi:hypothetical protein [Enterovibrio norvegicus]|uniref:hypothetical protein n=1 Tax=Enterovibrio norvegicus TaxID=188144 RepID=UPI00352D5409